jgi:hypothetical protein
VGLLNEPFQYANLHIALPMNLTAARFAVIVTFYF